MLGNLFKSKKETTYVQEPNAEKSRQLMYVDISKDAIISNAKQQNITVTDSELEWIKGELFDRVMKDVDASIQNNLFAYYSEVAAAVIGALGGDAFMSKLKGYKKVLLGIEIALPINKSRADSVLITKYEKTYTMIFCGKDVHIPVYDISLEQVVSTFTAITGITAAVEPLMDEIFEVIESEAPKSSKKAA